MSRAPEPSHHTVRFYDSDAYLLEQLAEFALEGLMLRERVVIIATAEHLRALQRTVADAGVSAERLVTLDATEVLDLIVKDGQLQEEEMGHLFSAVLPHGRRCRVYGEMVAVLATRGMLDIALEVEAAGNKLAARGVNVLCAYHLLHLGGEETTRAIGALHDQAFSERDSWVGAPDLGSPLVLIADDFDDARELYEEYLRFSGMRVVAASSGEEAVRLSNACPPDVVLMDIRMPGMSGNEAMRLLRQQPGMARVPIIALTAHALDSERAAIMADGFDGVISKPCLPDELLAIIKARIADARQVE